MKNRLIHLFEQKKKNLLSIFFTAGYPRLEDTTMIAASLQDAGVDLIEIGIPFSDPLADGPVIQESNKVALANGMTVAILLEQVRTLRQTVHIPVLLMGYLNPIMQYGIERFVRDAAEAGIDGLIVPDLPLSEFEHHFLSLFQSHHISYVFLLAPTTSSSRLAEIERLSTSFIYAVSSSSTTGARSGFSPDQLSYFRTLQQHPFRLPVLIGFGISNRESFQTVCQYCAGGVIGSAFISQLYSGSDLGPAISQFVAAIRPFE